MTTPSEAEFLENLSACTAELNAIFARCAETYSDFGLSPADFREVVIGAVNKYLIGFAQGTRVPSIPELRRFIAELQALDLYIALGCARGNEQAWWEFDRAHRSFIEHWAHRL